MRMRSYRSPRPGHGGLAALSLAGLVLAACSGPQQASSPAATTASGASTTASGGLAQRLGLPGGQTSDSTALSAGTATAAGSTLANLAQRRDCPSAELRDGTQTERIYEEGRQGDPTGVLYQGSITRVARECIYGTDGSVSVRFGVSGRVVLGPLGLPGPQTVSIRAVLFSEATGAVWSELFPVSVDLRPGSANQRFTLIQQTPAPLIPAGDTGGYRVIIGFDSAQGA